MKNRKKIQDKKKKVLNYCTSKNISNYFKYAIENCQKHYDSEKKQRRNLIVN